jgi:hypothetical protein
MKKLFLTTFLLLIIPNICSATLPTTTGSLATADSGSSSVTSLAISNFVVAGGLTNSALIVIVTAGAGATSGVVWNTSENFTQVTAYQRGFNTSVWILVNPTAGTHDVAVTCASGAHRMSAQTFTGVKQTTPTSLGGNIGADGVTTLSMNLTSTSTDSLLIDASSLNGAGGVTHGDSQTEITLISPDSGSNPSETATYKAAASPGAYTMTENHGTSGSIEITAFELKAAPTVSNPVIIQPTIFE